jgi:hypothetical protein
MGHWLLIVNKKDRKHIYGFKKRIKSKEDFMNLRLLKKYFKLGIILSVLSLTACQFSPTSTTVTITNDTNEEIVYWLSYRLGDMQNIKDRAPTLAAGESRTWIIKGTLSAFAETKKGLHVYVLSSENFDELKYGRYKSLDDWHILLREGISGDFDVADSYEVSITGTASDSDIILK